MHALCERTCSHNPTLWVVTTTGDQHCRALHGTSKRERNSGLRALPAHAPALKPPRKARFLFSKSSISLDCFPLFHRNRIGKPGFWSGFQARKARFPPPNPGFWSDFQARKARFSSPKPGRNRTKNRPPKPLCLRARTISKEYNAPGTASLDSHSSDSCAMIAASESTCELP